MRTNKFQQVAASRVKIILVVAVAVMGAVALGACGGSNSSQADENIKVISRFIQEFKNNANHDIVDALFTPGFVHHFKDPRLPPGSQAIKLIGQSIVAGFPDVQVSVEDLLADGDKVIERTTARATHTGEFNGIPATGKQVVWTEIHIYRLEDGKIAELWSEIDLLGLLTQLGAIPAP